MLVIAIIAILAGLLYPVIIGARQRAKEKQAMAETRTIVMAIKGYRQEYGKWPAQIQATQDTTYIISNYCVIQPLLGSNWNGFNPKNKIFLNLQVSTNNPDNNGTGNYLDPWGIPYVICMDENGDNKLLIDTNLVYYVSSNASERQIGATNISISMVTIGVVTNEAYVDAGAASLGGTSNDITKFNSWTELQ